MSDIVRPEDAHRLMWEMSLGEFLDEAVRREPHKVFVEMSGHALTYSEFRQTARETAALFQSMGVGKGDRVCLLLPNCLEFLYCWFGLSLLGAISVPINTAYKRDETAYILNDAEACALVAHEALAQVAQEAANLAPSVRHRLLVAGGPPSSASSASPGPGQEGWTIFSQALSWTQPMGSAPPVSPNDISMLVYTSGTTGNPKGVMVSHQMYVAAGQGFAHWTQATPEDRFFTCLPYYHANVHIPTK